MSMTYNSNSNTGGALEFGWTITQSKLPGGGGLPLSHVCGARAALRQIHGFKMIVNTSDSLIGLILEGLVENSKRDATLQGWIRQTGDLAARQLALFIGFCQPNRLLPVEPDDPVESFRTALADALAGLTSQTVLLCSDMTPSWASLWMALRGNLAVVIQNPDVLISGEAV